MQVDVAEPHEVAEWRREMERDATPEALEALAAVERRDVVLGSLYVEATYGADDDDAVGLTIAGVELRRGEEPLAQLDEEWIADALAECADQLRDEQAIEVTVEELREVLTVQASTDLLAALD